MSQERPVNLTKVLEEIQGPNSEEVELRKEVKALADKEYFNLQVKNGSSDTPSKKGKKKKK